MVTDIDLRRKEIRFRARRGLKEIDLLLQAFLNQQLEALSAQELIELCALLQCYDQDLLAWCIEGKPCPTAYAPLVQRLRQQAQALWREVPT